MPLVEYVGNATPQDNTEVLKLSAAADGQPRSLHRGKRALVSARELRDIAANYQVKVIEETGDESTPADEIPTEMPDGYDEGGYTPDEAPSDVVYTPEAYPDEASEKATDSSPSPSSPPSPPSPSPSVPTSISGAPSPSPSSPSPSAPASPGASG